MLNRVMDLFSPLIWTPVTSLDGRSILVQASALSLLLINVSDLDFCAFDRRCVEGYIGVKWEFALEFPRKSM